MEKKHPKRFLICSQNTLQLMINRKSIEIGFISEIIKKDLLADLGKNIKISMLFFIL